MSRTLCLSLLVFAIAFAAASPVGAVVLTKDIAYAGIDDERRKLDVYAPDDAKNLPVVFWIHGGGWQVGDKSNMVEKPKAFVERGFVFVATNHRFLPHVEMETILADVAKSIRWVHDHIAEYGGDPTRVLVMGHSSGAQLAALVSIDERYLKAEGLGLNLIRGCVPVDGDTYDVPLVIAADTAVRKAAGKPEPKYGHYKKFGNDPAKHRDLSAVTHIARDKGIPPFLILHVADDVRTTAQAKRLGDVLTEAGVKARVFGAPDTDHRKINANLGVAGDPSTDALMQFSLDAVGAGSVSR